eukprot:2979801-Pyramimonas_sp.AAC.1
MAGAFFGAGRTAGRLRAPPPGARSSLIEFGQTRSRQSLVRPLRVDRRAPIALRPTRGKSKIV